MLLCGPWLLIFCHRKEKMNAARGNNEESRKRNILIVKKGRTITGVKEQRSRKQTGGKEGPLPASGPIKKRQLWPLKPMVTAEKIPHHT
ncbi:MAG: hypothetical protein JNM19_08070 [Chitinophagaceae bacterium]|nr:hypothetical protein [Chitinophagaceae bacterium]